MIAFAGYPTLLIWDGEKMEFKTLFCHFSRYAIPFPFIIFNFHFGSNGLFAFAHRFHPMPNMHAPVH